MMMGRHFHDATSNREPDSISQVEKFKVILGPLRENNKRDKHCFAILRSQIYNFVMIISNLGCAFFSN